MVCLKIIRNTKEAITRRNTLKTEDTIKEAIFKVFFNTLKILNYNKNNHYLLIKKKVYGCIPFWC